MPYLAANMSSSVSYSSSLSSSSSSNSHQFGAHHTYQAQLNSDGTSTVHTTSEQLGQPASAETHHYDSSGREHHDNEGQGIQARLGAADGGPSVEDVTDSEAQKERDALYEQRMEDEYAKREGGA